MRLIVVFLIALSFAGCFSNAGKNNNEDQKVVNVYTDRHYPIDDTLYKHFEKEFGIKVNVVKGKSEDLLARLDKEGKSTKADLLITADVGRLYQAKKAGFFQLLGESDELKTVPLHLKDADGFWTGLTKRARIIVYAKERVDASELTSYEDLTDEKWKGRIAVRSKENIYNQSLLSGIIAANGEEKAEEWVRGIVENMYQSPKGNDRDQVKAVFGGNADVAIVNTYYLGQMLYSDDALEREAAEAVALFFPNQNGRGTHINVSGVGIVNNAVNKENAQLLINYLLRPEVQMIFAQENFEFPVHPDVKPSKAVQSWGDFKEDTVKLSRIGELNALAIKIFDKGGWR